ncbi:hypothetical protein Bp8pS_221 [Bacillus phage vB_BpuM-BpSp]|nr:hypothetical protein Bp8pS_221 [Bacillus phage vB_BpuM-BpSp]
MEDIVIELFPSYIKISNYDRNEKLEKALSVFDKTIFQYVFSAFLIDEDKKEIIIPGGLDLEYLKNLFNDKEVINRKDQINKYQNVKLNIKYPPRNAKQEEAINFLINEKNTQKFLVLPTGEGKTYCAINYVVNSKKLPLVIVDKENISNQWKESFLKFTDIKENEIYLISGKESIDNLMGMGRRELSKYKCFIAIHKTLTNLINKDMNNFRELITHLRIGSKLYDEAHSDFKNIFLLDSLSECESVYITATPSRSNHIENAVYQRMFKNVSFFIYTTESTSNYHNIVIAKYNTNPTKKEQYSIRNRYGFDANKWSKRLIKDEDVYNQTFENIKTLIKKLNPDFNKKTVILINTMDGVSSLLKDLKEDFPNLSFGRYDSTIKKEDKLEQLNRDIIVTTEKSLGKAIDVPNLELCINLIPFGSNVIAEQMLGRLRRIEGKTLVFVDMIDIGFESCLQQLKRKKNIYNKKAKNIYELSL